MKYNSINNRLCYFADGRVFCWRKDMIKILDTLTEDGYVLVDWKIIPEIVQLWFDFDCYMVLDTVEEMEIKAIENERRSNIRAAPILS